MSFLYKFFVFLSFIILFGTFNGCITNRSSVNSIQNVSDSLSYEHQFEFKYQFFKANQYFLEGKLDLSLSLFNGCLKIDPYSSAVHYKISSIYLHQNELSLAEKHSELAVLYNPSNTWYLYLAGTIYSLNNNVEKAKLAFTSLIDRNPDEIQYYFSLADIYLKAEDYDGTIKISNLIEEKFGVSESISLQKNKLYLAQNKMKEAFKELNKLSSAFPQSIVYKRYIAEFYFKTNSVNDAILQYQSILNEFPNDGLSHIGLADCYRIKGMYNESISHVKLAFVSEELPSDYKFNVLISLLQIIDKDPRLQKDTYFLSELLYEQYPNDPDIVTVFANFKLQVNELDTARMLLTNVIQIRKDKYAVWEQLILLDNEFSDWEALYNHSNEALTYFPNQSFLYFFKGYSSFQLKNFSVAINSFSFGLKLTTKDDPLKLDFMSYLGESYYQTDLKQEAYDIFDQLLEIDSENIMVLNNYAYYLSLENIKLLKAEEMSAITIRLEPDNATYLDTYAWILFMQGKNDSALVFIEKAINNDSNTSDVVLEHYGDILFFNDRIDDALIQWRKARLLGEGSGLLDKKINEKKYFK